MLMLTPPEADRLRDLRAKIVELPPRCAVMLHALCDEGLQNKAIAARLRLSVRAIEMDRARLYAAMGVDSPAALGRVYGEWRTLDRHEQLTAAVSQVNAPTGHDAA